MKLGETDPTARRIGPIKAVVWDEVELDYVPVTDFSAPGAVEVKVNGGPWAAAGGSVVVINDEAGDPSGFVYYQATEPDRSVRGFIAVKLSVVCDEMVVREEVEEVPQGIPVDTTDEDLLVVGPLQAFDTEGAPVLGGAGIDVVISINGAAWEDDFAGELVETSDGYYDYIPDPSEATARGWIAVKISGACNEYVSRATIVTENVADAGYAPPELGTSFEEQPAVSGFLGGDIALTWDPALGNADVTLTNWDLTTDRGLQTAVLLSLFTDRRALDDDIPPSGDSTDRRGWWADEFAEVEGDLIGSRIWLLDRSKAVNETALRLKEYALEALAWMLEDRVVESINVPVEIDGDRLLWGVELQRPGKDKVPFRFGNLWDHLQENT
jgi:phage gp46-like protein